METLLKVLSYLSVLGLGAIIICLIILVIFLIIKKPVRKAVISLIISFLVLLISFSTLVGIQVVHPEYKNKEEDISATSETEVFNYTAEEIIDKLANAKYPISDVVVYSSADDPDNLLGKPNEYTSKAQFTDSYSKCEYTIEVYKTKENVDSKVQKHSGYNYIVSSGYFYWPINNVVIKRPLNNYNTPNGETYYRAICSILSNSTIPTYTYIKENPTTQSSTTTQSPTVATIPAEYKSALAKANSYANGQYMSKARLYRQLTSEYGEQFSQEAAQYAIDNVNTDYYKNALATAHYYQSRQNMSPSRIYQQLTSEYGEQFTADEAQYAIDHLND